MDKIVFNDDTEFEICEGASLDNIKIVLESFSDLEEVTNVFLQSDSLSEVKFVSDDVVTGVYHDMILNAPIFSGVDYLDDEKHVIASFSLREKTSLEKRIEEIEEGQALQDGAIADLGDAMSTIEEGGAL